MSRYIEDISSIFQMSVNPDTILGIDNWLSEKSKKNLNNIDDISPMSKYRQCRR